MAVTNVQDGRLIDAIHSSLAKSDGRPIDLAMNSTLQRRPSSAGDWEAWRLALADTQRTRGPRRFGAGRSSPLTWGLPADVRAGWGIERRSGCIEPLGSLRLQSDAEIASAVVRWLADASQASCPRSSIESLCLAEALPAMAARLTESAWWELWEYLVDLAVRGLAGSVADDLWVSQLLACELPLMLALQFTSLEVCQELGRRGAANLENGLEQLLDADGCLPAGHSRLTYALLACWARSFVMADRLALLSGKNALKGLRKMAVHALRWSRHNGAPVLLPTHTVADAKDATELLATVAGLGQVAWTDRRDEPRQKTSRRRKGRSVTPVSLPAAGMNSESGQVAILRSDWSRLGPRLTVAYYGDLWQSEMSCGGQVLWSGESKVEVALDGQTLAPTGEWTQACWVSDEDVDYLELELSLAEGVCLQRHVLLAHEDRLLLMADAVLAPEGLRIDYRLTMPLAPGVTWEPAPETCEACLLVGSRRRARLLPLYLPEWRSESRQGGLRVVEAGSEGDRGDFLELRQSVAGRRTLFSPLVLDLAGARFNRPLTWRPLTVADARQVQPPDVAAGYRLQIGGQQWLLYRSLAEPGNRTLLGHNLISEFLFARFNRQGKVAPLLEIEP